ncbi:unnamed protein product, partial [Brenthis ino]
MGIFGASSPFDQDVERATSENNTSEEWGLILEICDRAGASAGAARDCLRAVLRRLAHADPHVQMHAATLLDACVANCGRHFHLEVASREFEAEFRRLVARAQPAVAQRLRAALRKWAEGEFRSDPQLDLIPSLHAKLAAEAGERAPAAAPAAADAQTVSAAEKREQEELARAIALSLRESGAGAAGAGAGAGAGGALYPRVDEAPPPAAAAPAAPRKVRALYDFEAAEDNELTFLAGETVHVTDWSDPNWWKGYNERGEGLFPANFVTAEAEAPRSPERAGERERERRAPSADDEPLAIDEAAMDAALAALHEADPSAPDAGASAPDRREARVLRMGPLVDAALERADRRHARLTQLSADLVDALKPLPRPHARPQARARAARRLPPLRAAAGRAAPGRVAPGRAGPGRAAPRAAPALPPGVLPPARRPRARCPPRCPRRCPRARRRRRAADGGPKRYCK